MSLREWTVAGGLIETESGVLLVRNQRRGGFEDWSTPGGVIDAEDADLLAGLSREVFEETGLIVNEWLGPLYEVRAYAPDMGWRMRCEVHLAAGFEGELHVDDPDGIVVEACFVPHLECDAHLESCVPWVREPLTAWLRERWEPRAGRGFDYEVNGSTRDSIQVVRGASDSLPAESREDAAILHVDLDAFYASVEQLDDRTLRGRPVIVGGLGARGVVSAASYEARRFGVHSAMPMGRARALCPTAAFLPPRFERYSTKSREVMEILESVTPLVEQLSIDEAFLDVSGARRLLGTGTEIAAFLRGRIRTQAGLVASVGVATTKFLAKLASDLAKPNGLLAVEPGTERAFLAPLPVTRLWGVGPATLARLERMAVHTIGELAALPESSFTAALGTSLGTRLHALATNVDPRAVIPEREAKSIGAEETYAADLRGRPGCDRELVRLVDRVRARLRRAELCARTVTLKIRFDDFETRTRAHTIPLATDVSTVILATVRELLEELDFSRGVRLLGVSLSQLEAPGPVQGVFALDEAGSSDHARVERRAAVEHAVDAVRDRFGSLAVGPASLVERKSEDL